ncbi:uncharacterized protein C8R40DRAFT_1065201 [Lentinula edodes]|uniref:uncharacterized protein n=1 Tax=Lentinula edodes TaxID=5353 RepID=UPI001E8DD87B|nr:uncharacterized protein C8R40DRAFT_1065201 [Lentinula edodes]KAH7881547.1 hypothetical protein C8R40DRAFT_1065201 [Lentinula edodes]
MYLHYYSSGYKAYLIVILGFLSIFTTAVPHQDSSLPNLNPAGVANSVQQLGSSILPRQKGTYPHFSVQLQFRDRGRSSDEKKKKKQVATTAVQALLNLAILDLGFSSIKISQVEGFPVVNKQGNVDFRITLLPLKDEPATIYDGLVNLSSNAVNGHLSRSSMVIVNIVNGIVQKGLPTHTSNKKGTNVEFDVHSDQIVTFNKNDAPSKLFRMEILLSVKTCFTQKASAEALVPAQE